jgi:TonB family protein
MATVTTSEFVKGREPIASFSMIEHKGIFARLLEEGSLAVSDFTRDPKGFLREIFSDEAKDAQRSKRLRMGLAFGLAFQVVAITAIAIAGWHHATTANRTDEPEYGTLRIFDFGKTPQKDNIKESSKESDTSGRTSNVLKGTPDAGSQSGGSGQNNPSPPQQGSPPPSSPIPPMISLTAPDSQTPSLPVNPTIEGSASLLPLPNAPIGALSGTPNTNSGGPGTGGNIGTGTDNGVGDDKGPGGGDTPGGRGKEGGTKSGPPGSKEGITLTGPIDYEILKTIPGSTNISWISRVRPIVTSEAQADKVVGYVLLEATFNANGTITDIRVRQSLGSMDDAAKESLQRARFRPATVKGEPVTLRKVLIRINVNMG